MVDLTQDTKLARKKRYGLVMVWGEIEDMGKFTCKVCGGKGHPWRTCETLRRVNNISGMNLTVRNRLALVRTQIGIEEAEHVAVGGQVRPQAGVGFLAGVDPYRRARMGVSMALAIPNDAVPGLAGNNGNGGH